jgi:hypothetical protein
MATFLLLGFIAFIALPSILWLYALADVARNGFRHFTTKIAWLIILCVFPPLGTILYFLFGRDQRITCYPVGKVVFIIIFIIPALMILGYILFSLGHLAFLPKPPDTLQI